MMMNSAVIIIYLIGNYCYKILHNVYQTLARCSSSGSIPRDRRVCVNLQAVDEMTHTDLLKIHCFPSNQGGV